MFRKTRGAILCPSCGRLINADAPVCLVCGRRNPGMWGFAGPLRRVFRTLDFTNAGPVVCVALYIARLVVLFPVAGAAGFVASTTVGGPFTKGPSVVLGRLIASFVAYGRKRGGV